MRIMPIQELKWESHQNGKIQVSGGSNLELPPNMSFTIIVMTPSNRKTYIKITQSS